jgi:Glyoxalase/Bleomycin resistance protein/Dioxygenase superfamily
VEAHAPDNASTATASAPRDGLSSMSYMCIAVVVADLERAIEWYGRVLGFAESVRIRSVGATWHSLRDAARCWNSYSTTNGA